MPIPVACFGVGGGDEPERALEALGAPFARPPQIEAGHGEEKESEVARAVDRFTDWAVGSAEGELAVPVFHELQEITRARGGDLADFTGERMGVKRLVAAGGERDRGERVVFEREAGKFSGRMGGAHARLELSETQARGFSDRRRDAAGVALGEGDQFFFKSERGAGEAHDADRQARDETGEQVEPKKRFTKCHEKAGGELQDQPGADAPRERKKGHSRRADARMDI